MGDSVSEPAFPSTVLRPWPAWAPLREAAQYARMSPEKLLSLTRQAEITGYPNPDFRRGAKGEGEWWIHLPSVDAYHERKSGQGVVRAAVLARKRGGGV